MRQLKIIHNVTRERKDIRNYLNEISKIPLLTDDEEIALARKIKNGDGEALQKLVKSNTRFAVSVAKQYQNQGLLLVDLISEANLGLIRAAQKFDETRGFKFISYAVWWIRQSILQAIAEQARIVRLPLNKIGAYNKIVRTGIEFEQEYGHEPTREKMEELMRINKREIDEIIRAGQKYISLDAPFSEDDEDRASLYDIISDEDASGSEICAVKESLKIEVSTALKSLSERDADIVRYYFGIKGETHQTLDEIGKKFKLTRERIRQIKERSLRKLRKTTSSKELRGYV